MKAPDNFFDVNKDKALYRVLSSNRKLNLIVDKVYIEDMFDSFISESNEHVLKIRLYCKDQICWFSQMKLPYENKLNSYKEYMNDLFIPVQFGTAYYYVYFTNSKRKLRKYLKSIIK